MVGLVLVVCVIGSLAGSGRLVQLGAGLALRGRRLTALVLRFGRHDGIEELLFVFCCDSWVVSLEIGSLG